jgi:hypothetical protein
VGCPGGLDRLVQLALGLVQQFLGLRSVAGHVVVIRGPGAIHLVDRFQHVVVNLVEIVPVVHRVGTGHTAGERQGGGDSKHSFPHVDSLEVDDHPQRVPRPVMGNSSAAPRSLVGPS